MMDKAAREKALETWRVTAEMIEAFRVGYNGYTGSYDIGRSRLETDAIRAGLEFATLGQPYAQFVADYARRIDAADSVSDYALAITKTLTNLVGGGSEMFSGRLLKDTPREMYKADLQHCERRLRDRFTLAADRADEQLRKFREADSDNARLRARVSELEAALAWRPISEAPKDGMKILAINNRGNCAVILWGADGWICVFSDGRPHPFWNGACGSNPTHWRPLPAPPVGDR